MVAPRSLNYRSDIDGLRGIAISLVLFFHLFPEWLSGGFVGVDVFFVISGFLITSIIRSKFEQGTWSIFAFYGARIRRLFPSLLVVLVFALVIGWKVLLPDEYLNLGRHVKGGLGFFENFLLRREAGYFDVQIAAKPLAHLWSLSIEEQFYVLFPLLLWLIRGRGRVGFWVLLVLFSASFGYNLWAAYVISSEIYLLPWTRFWELMVGSLLAFGQNSMRLDRLSARTSQGLILIGMALILGSAVMVRESTIFPGWPALVPVLGALAVIVGGGRPGTIPGLIASRPLVMIGLISYPLYLWHWTLRSFLMLEVGNTPTLIARSGVGLLSVVLAFLCYRYLEVPVRNSAWRSTVSGLLMLGAILIAVFAMVLVQGKGFPERFPALLSASLDRSPPEWRIGRCLLRGSQVPRDFAAECFATEASKAHPGRKKILLWGDSFSAHLYPGLISLPGPAVRVSQFGMVACFPSSGYQSKSAQNCPKVNDFVLGQLAREHYDLVIIAANWEKYPRDLIDQSLPQTLAELRARGVRKVVLFGPPPRWTMPLPRLIARRVDSPERLGAGFLSNDSSVEERLRKLAKDEAVGFVSIQNHLCNARGCLVRWEHELTATDEEHLSPSGARFLVHDLHDIEGD